jgi:chromosome segregation ATPase
MDFGVEAANLDSSNQLSQVALNAESPTKVKAPSKTEEVSREILPSKFIFCLSFIALANPSIALTASMAEMQSQFSAELRILQDRIDTSTTQIRDLSAEQKALSSEVEARQSLLRARQDRKQRIQNLRRALTEMRDRVLANHSHSRDPTKALLPTMALGDADREFQATPDVASDDLATLNVRLGTYNGLNASLSAHLSSLKARDTELESKYRKVVALCTNVPEVKVDSVLGQLVTAVESERENDVGRVREFLKRVEAVTGSG